MLKQTINYYHIQTSCKYNTQCVLVWWCSKIHRCIEIFRPVKVGETTRDIQEIRRKIDQVDDDDFISALRNGHSDRVFLLQMR